MAHIDLRKHGITVEDIRRNLPPAKLYAEAIREDPKSAIANSGALIAYSGAKTGRSPKDKRVVKHPATEKDVWWGSSMFRSTTPRSRSTWSGPRTT